jgi:hypothetical protein
MTKITWRTMIVGGLAALLCSLLLVAVTSPPAPPTRPQTIAEKVQAAVAAKHSCKPELRYISTVPSNATDNVGGTMSIAGCGRWLYMVPANADGQVYEVDRFTATEWSGR